MIRNYKDTDYEQLRDLYMHPEWFGGQFDAARDSREGLAGIVSRDPEAILVCEEDGKIVGSVSLIEDGRVAWLFRFAVKDNKHEVAEELYKKAADIFKLRGHTQILAYTPVDNHKLKSRYNALDMKEGTDYTSYSKDI
jgi:ribosomal protein S18 acetylase RimI-like enzyme